jgi:hypothetical protein
MWTTAPIATLGGRLGEDRTYAGPPTSATRRSPIAEVIQLARDSYLSVNSSYLEELAPVVPLLAGK